MRLVVLVDGEHYPPVVRSAIGRLRARGDDIIAAVFLGGSEKVREGDLDAAYGIALEQAGEARSGGRAGTIDDQVAVLSALLAANDVDAVLDLSDEPVVSAADRFRLAAHTLVRDVRYLGPDFELRPVRMEPILTKPSIRVIATGKRTGKTAVSGALARHAVRAGRNPVIVAMGRGGPDTPQLVPAGTKLGADELLAIADSGRHAASDYLEDAVTTGVTTIGCRRVGGGLAGATFESNVPEGARMAEGLDADVVVLEGSGAAIPPVKANAGLVCVPAFIDPAALAGHLNPYRLLLSDVAVVTMAEDKAQTARIESTIRGLVPRIEIVRAVLRPSPLASVRDRRVFLCTTAPAAAGAGLRRHLEESHGCVVAGISHSLADRVSLARELGNAAEYDVLLTEVKGAAVDVAARQALEQGAQVVFVDNAIVGEGIAAAFDLLLEQAFLRNR